MILEGGASGLSGELAVRLPPIWGGGLGHQLLLNCTAVFFCCHSSFLLFSILLSIFCRKKALSL